MTKLPAIQRQAMAWITTYGGGAFRVKTGRWHPIDSDSRLIHQKTIAALVERGLLVWIGQEVYIKRRAYYSRPTACSLPDRKWWLDKSTNKFSRATVSRNVEVVK